MELGKHEKMMGCGKCDFETNLKNELMNHVKNAHSVKDTFSCNQCSYKTGTKVKLEEHIKFKHSQIRPVCKFFLDDKCTRAGLVAIKSGFFLQLNELSIGFTTFFGNLMRNDSQFYPIVAKLMEFASQFYPIIAKLMELATRFHQIVTKLMELASQFHPIIHKWMNIASRFGDK